VNRQSNQGFTLVEMLVVLAIMAVMLTMSLPYVKGSGDARILDAVAQTMAARLRNEQASAVSTNTERSIEIDLKNMAMLNPFYKLPAGIALHIETAENQIDEGSASFRFFADGGSTGGKIQISKATMKREIDINWLNGAVVVSTPSL
jgi:general secretion pathway protein H